MNASSALPFPNGSDVFSGERKRAIVFGGAGFIGSHLLKRLAASYPDAELYSVDTSVEPRFRVEGVHYVEHDVSKAIPRQLCGTGDATIFNLAAVHTTPGHEDWEYYHTNILGACNVCRLCIANWGAAHRFHQLDCCLRTGRGSPGRGFRNRAC